MTEFDWIKLFTAQFEVSPPPQGPGDDAAVVPNLPNLCVTTDSVVEGVHFSRRAFSPEDIGYKALAVNLSDLAAMGATPAWFLVSLCFPKGTPRAEIVGIARGMSKLALAAAIRLVGGNFSRARELSVCICAAGTASRPLRRSGGRPGDLLYVSGKLGDARLGLRLLKSRRPVAKSAAVKRQKRPLPRLRLGKIAARYASAGIDISDGLTQDLGHLCQASGVGAWVEANRLPISNEVRKACGDGAALWALAGGEDYELLIAVSRSRSKELERECESVGEKITCVGELTVDKKVVFQASGARLHTIPAGYDHFRR